jgi:hypothetical protein
MADLKADLKHDVLRAGPPSADMIDSGRPKCAHRAAAPGGKCRACGVDLCHIGVEGCRCAVGWPYELQCPECRDIENRMDDGYCVCVPSFTPPRPTPSEQPGPAFERQDFSL